LNVLTTKKCDDTLDVASAIKHFDKYCECNILRGGFIVKKTVYLSEYIHPEAAALLKEHCAVVDDFEQIEKIDAIILRNITVTREMMVRAKNLKVIGKHGVGCNTIDLIAAKELGKMVLFTPTTNINSVAEMIVGLIIDLYRHIHVANQGVRNNEYKTIAPPSLIGNEIAGKTVALVGFGNVNKKVAAILKNGFGVECVAYDPYVSREVTDPLGIRKGASLEDAIQNADIVTVSVPYVESTKNLIAGQVFDWFKPSAILINTARGGIVNEDDLYAALVAKKLKAAACDVFLQEPPTIENKLLGLRNFCATPHIGGSTEESLYRTGMEVVQETINVLNGNAPKHPAI
jgi:D-3-phosphoglycerate dehydrogenase